MVELEWAGERLRLLPEKAVFWPAARTLILADMHLGKPAAFRHAGIAVPESTAADLERLAWLVRTTQSRRLIILGDLFHAREGLQSVMLEQVGLWRKAHAELEIVLVPGNHDRKSGAPPVDWNVRSVPAVWSCDPFVFSHAPVEASEGHVMAGHVHPAVRLRDKFGPGIRAACFCFRKHLALLPAFGSFTGMSDYEPLPGDRVFIAGNDTVLEL